jgi:hypothetical protein
MFKARNLIKYAKDFNHLTVKRKGFVLSDMCLRAVEWEEDSKKERKKKKNISRDGKREETRRQD